MLVVFFLHQSINEILGANTLVGDHTGANLKARKRVQKIVSLNNKNNRNEKG